MFLLLSIAAVVAAADTAAVTAPAQITLEQALEIALSENVSVKVADLEVEKTGYARKGTYSALFPTVDASGTYQRTIEKQVMYMDFDMSSLTGGGTGGDSSSESSETKASSSSSSSGGGIEVGRWNTWSAGVSASMPLVNAQLWQSLHISDLDVELAVEKARGSKLEMVTQVKQAYYAVLLAKQAFEVYRSVYDNAVANLELTQKKYDAHKASDLDLLRSQTTVANATPNMYDSESGIVIALWQLKAVMGVDLDANLDVVGTLSDYSDDMLSQPMFSGDLSLTDNSSIRQLSLQAAELATTIKMQQYANLPSLAVAFNYSYNAMTNDFNFSEYRWSPYSYVGLSLNIPIFAGGKRANAIKQARVQSTELALQQANTERQLRISIQQSLNTMDTALKTYDAASTALGSAQKAYDISAASYEVGSATLTDLNDAQLQLVQAQLNVCQAIYSYIVAKSSLEQTLGHDFTNE